MGNYTRPRLGTAGDRGRHRVMPTPRSGSGLATTARWTGSLLAAGVAAASVVVTGASSALAADTTTALRASVSPSQLAALRQCESGGNYRINTGNGFYGAYQFDLSTWHGLGYSGLPSAASPATQDQAVRTLQAQRGWAPWPACSKRLGLRGGPTSTAVAPSTRTHTVAPSTRTHTVAPSTRTHKVVRTPAPATHHAVSGIPAFDRTLTTALVSQRRIDVRVWQQRMRTRGWHLSVDGQFGSQSASIARQFAIEKRLRNTHGALDTSGTVGASAWLAAWTAPVT